MMIVQHIESYTPWNAGVESVIHHSRAIVSKVTQVGTSSLYKKTKRPTQISRIHTFSPLRLLFWTSLIVSARSQLTDPFPALFELSSLDGTNGFTINGEAQGDRLGISVSTAGDVNGDGLSDIVIGAWYANPEGKSAAGRCYVIYGSRNKFDGGIFDLNSLKGTNGFIINGESENDRLGIAVATAGDVNGDGVDDLVVGAREASPFGRTEAGKSYVIFGSNNIVKEASFNLARLDGTNGHTIIGESKIDWSGRSFSSGDLNGDGLSDLLIGAMKADVSGREGAGKSFVVFGSRKIVRGGIFELSKLNGTNGFIIKGEHTHDQSGYSVSLSGDLNGDGLLDIVIGARYANFLGKSNAGKSYVIFGSNKPSNDVIMDLLNTKIEGFFLAGDTEHDNCGISVSSSGDVNGDGIADILVGVSGDLYSSQSKQVGKTYLIFGNLSWSGSNNFRLSEHISRIDIVLKGEHAEDHSGNSVSIIDDVNGDGVDDILIGAPLLNLPDKTNAGKSYVIFGNRNFRDIVGKNHIIELSKLNGTDGFGIMGESRDDWSGWSIASAGDVNGDGMNDILIGAILADPLNRTNAGKAYVIFGRNTTKTTLTLPPFTTSMSSNVPINNLTFDSLHSNALNMTKVNIDHLSSSSIDISLIIGISITIATLAFSLFGGVVFFVRRRTKVSTNDQGTSMSEQNANSIANQYDQLPSGRSDGNYNDWPQEPKPHTKDQYDQVNLDQMNRERDQYQKAVTAKMQEGYDDIPKV